MPKPNEKSEEPEASQPACQQRSVLGRLLDTLSSFFTPSVDQGAVQVTTSPPVPPPAKFNIGDDFRSWELLAQRYIQNVPKHRQPDALLSLLSGEALSIAVENNIVTEPVTDHTFARLKSVLTPRTLAVESARAFHERRQLEGENITTYLRQLKRLAISGFPQDTVAEREIRLLDRLVEGVTNREIRKCFLLNPPRSLSTAVDVATRCEDVRGVLSSDSPNQPYYHTALARGGPNNRRRAPSRGYRSRVVGHPRWPIPLRREDCPYCQRFGNAARTCGHNDRRPPPRAMPVDSIWDALGRTLENAGNSLAERITSEVERKTQAMSDQLNTSIDDAIRRAWTRFKSWTAKQIFRNWMMFVSRGRIII
ncbi:unnamed protein product [Calicophoron daubneyi]|uniref:Gag protein n=1 Tax=Calicophoron daubneyi TaxID=300641 RepID=A0AAV2TR70_CALDB